MAAKNTFNIRHELAGLKRQLSPMDIQFLNDSYKVTGDWETSFRNLLDNCNIKHGHIA